MKFAAQAAKPAEKNALSNSICASRRLCLSVRRASVASASASNKPPTKPNVGITAGDPITIGGPPTTPLAVYSTSTDPDALTAPKPMRTSGSTPGICARGSDNSMTSAKLPPLNGTPLFNPTG